MPRLIDGDGDDDDDVDNSGVDALQHKVLYCPWAAICFFETADTVPMLTG